MNSLIQKITSENDKWKNMKYCLEVVKNNGYDLQYVRVQTLEICLTAVQEDGRALRYSKIQTPELCLAATKKHWKMIKYVKNQTPEIGLAAVQQNGWAITYLNIQTLETCLAAAKKCEDHSSKFIVNILDLLHRIKIKTPEIYLELVKRKPDLSELPDC